MKHGLGHEAPAFELIGVDGVMHSLEGLAGSAATLIIFSCNHCPYVHAYEGRMIAIAKRFAARGMATVAINANNDVTHPADTFDNMVARAKDMGYPFPYLRDESQAVAKAYGATRTPEVVLLDGNGVMRYRGRIDNNTYEPDHATEHCLVEAIEAVLSGRAVAKPETDPVGCTIKWK